MKVAIRYYSRGGNVEEMALALARGAGVEAISIDEPGAQIDEHIDLLFVGGALYAYMLDPLFKQYLLDLPEGMIDEAVCFGSSWLTRRPIYLIQDLLKEKGIKINKQALWSRNSPNDNLIEAIEYFGKSEVTRDRSLDGLPPYLVFKRSQEIKEAKERAKAEGREYVPEETPEQKEAARRRAADEARAEAEEAQRAAQEAQQAAEAAAKEAAEAARLALEKAEAAAAAAAQLEADAEEAEQAAVEEPVAAVIEETSAVEETANEE